MLFDVHALTAPEFDAWLARAIESAPPPPPPSGAPAPSGEPAPSGGPSQSGGPAPSGEPPPDGATVVQISAQNIAFQPTEVSAPSGVPFQIEFDNKDSQPHNVAIKDSAGQNVFEGEIFTGPAVRTYDVTGLAAGTYTFTCTVHPNMIGTLTAN
jgi:plastocyanin